MFESCHWMAFKNCLRKGIPERLSMIKTVTFEVSIDLCLEQEWNS